MIELAFHVRVVEALVAFTTAPEHVVLATEFEGDLHGLFHLRGSVGENVSVAAGGRAMHESRVREEVGGAPQELDARASLFFLENRDNSIEIVMRLLQCLAFGGDVSVVERVVRGSELLHQLKRHADSLAGIFDRVRSILPRANHGGSSERISTIAAHRVPVDHREPQVVPHRAAFNNFVFVVPTKGERVVGFGAFVGDLGNIGKRGHRESFRGARG